jgi:hypothetical protein
MLKEHRKAIRFIVEHITIGYKPLSDIFEITASRAWHLGRSRIEYSV